MQSDGRVTAADDQRRLSDGQFLAVRQPGKKIGPHIAPVQILTFNIQQVVFPRADSHEDGVISRGHKGCQIEINTEFHPGKGFDAEIENPFNLPVKRLFGQDGIREMPYRIMPPSLGMGFVYGHVMPHAS